MRSDASCGGPRGGRGGQPARWAPDRMDRPAAGAGLVEPGAEAVLGVPAWVVAVALNLLASALTVVGLALQKQAASAPPGSAPRLGHIVLSRRWVLGFLVGIVAPVPLQAAGYGLAPMSLISPLSGATVVLNVLLAPGILGERLQPRVDIPATCLILLGTAASTATGAHDEVRRDGRELLGLWGQPDFLLACGILLAAMLCCLGYMWSHRAHIEELALLRPSNPSVQHVLLPALVAAGCGCMSNIMLKAVAEQIFGSPLAPEAGLWILGALLPAVVQLNFVNKGLALYQQVVFLPVYTSLLILSCTLYGLIFYREYAELLEQGGQCALFSCGVLIIALGVNMFSLRRPFEFEAGAAELIGAASPS
ncbi:unnamed protein product [Prorocentrum cordatum]|uniref:Magnesium transporter n=1 Tax=Prorocentrum cordatum TaxID=2364126 RepID=A0ABN9S177_9DINO|nr:unnamed protein product [Polarella glacialis]